MAPGGGAPSLTVGRGRPAILPVLLQVLALMPELLLRARPPLYTDTPIKSLSKTVRLAGARTDFLG